MAVATLTTTKLGKWVTLHDIETSTLYYRHDDRAMRREIMPEMPKFLLPWQQVSARDRF